MCQQSSSRGGASPDLRVGQQKATDEAANEAGETEKEDDDGRATVIDRATSSAQLQPEIVATGNSRGSNEKADDVAGCRKPDVADAECRHCGFVFKHAAMFDIHMGFHKFDDPWCCNRCGHRCVDCVDFNRHIASAPHLGRI